MKRWYLILTIGALVSCASIPVKEKAVRSLQTSETILAQAQDLERQLCNPPLAAQTPPAVITTCTGAAATAAQLTDAKHQQYARALSAAFGVQIRAATALQAWRAGDPVPADLTALQTDVHDALAVIQTLIQGPQDSNVRNILTHIESAFTTISNAISELKAGK